MGPAFQSLSNSSPVPNKPYGFRECKIITVNNHLATERAEELCESRDALRAGLPVPTSLCGRKATVAGKATLGGGDSSVVRAPDS